MGGMVIQHKAQRIMLRIPAVQHFKLLYKITTFMGITYQRNDLPCKEV